MMEEHVASKGRRQPFLAVLRAFGPGALTGILTSQAERAWLQLSPGLTEVAVYCLIGGTLSALGWLIGQLAGVRAVARALAGAGACILPASFLVYLLNVRVLAGEVFTSPLSLAGDAAVAVFCLLVALAVTWLAHLVFRGQTASGALAAVAGLLLAASAVLVVIGASHLNRRPVRRGSSPLERPNLLLVMQDSVRRDHLGFHGYPLPTSPTLDDIATTSRVFERVYAASSWTVPSVDWILDLRDLDPPRLPQRLATLGYRSACLTDNPHLTRQSEVLRGFDLVERSVGVWRSLFRSTVVGEMLERLAPGKDEWLVDRALTWLRDVKDPLFLYVHLMDSHAPYDEPPIDGVSRPGRRVEFPVAGMKLSAAEREDIVARYDGGLLSTDAQVGRLLEAMAARDRPFLAIVASDHGESLGEYGRWYHGGSLAPELLAVHLVVTGANVTAGRATGPVGFSSVAKTLLLAAGDSYEGYPGIDLRWGQREPFVEGALPPDLLYRIEDGYKLVWDVSKATAQLFDLKNDPEELTDVAAEKSDRAAALREKLGSPRDLPRPDPAARERLRALGYIEND
jgi:hypothetical protein